jgi:molecular chaperone GrpE
MGTMMFDWLHVGWNRKRDKADRDPRTELAHFKHQYRSAIQEIDEMRARFIKQSDRHKQYTEERILRDFLPIVDSLHRAIESSTEPENPWLHGVQHTYQQFQNILAKYKVEPVPCQGCPFDPEWHEAVSTMPSPLQKDGTVIHVIEQGYRIDDKLLRAAKVVVVKNEE